MNTDIKTVNIYHILWHMRQNDAASIMCLLTEDDLNPSASYCLTYNEYNFTTRNADHYFVYNKTCKHSVHSIAAAFNSRVLRKHMFIFFFFTEGWYSSPLRLSTRQR